MRNKRALSLTLLIDADVLCHQMSYAATTRVDWSKGNVWDAPTLDHAEKPRSDTTDCTEVLRPELMRARIRGFMAQMMDDFSATDAIIVLSDRGYNFRKQLAPYYKAKRKPKPTLWEQTRAYCETGVSDQFRVECWPGLEGDDVIGILHTGEFAGRSMMVTLSLIHI